MLLLYIKKGAYLMQEITIDNDFRCLLPTLDEETYETLEANLIKNGCRDALVVWNGFLIDGHNRYEICTRHNIPFIIIEKEFPSREFVLIWIISNQMSRRNLTPMQLSHFRGLHYRADKKIRGSNNQYADKSEKSQNATFHSSTSVRLAKQYKISRDTVLRDAKVSTAIDAIGETSLEAKRMILSGDVDIDKRVLEELSSWPKEEIESAAEAIASGTYEKKKPGSQTNKKVPVDPPPDDIRLWDMAISDITNGFYSEMHKLNADGGIVGLKPLFKSYISALEDLYRYM